MAEQHSGTAAAAGGGERGGRHNRGRAGRSRGGRGGGRGGRSRGGAQAASTGQQNQPSEAVQAPAATQPPRADGSTPGQAQTGRGSRRTRNARRGGANTGQRTTFGAHRAFGGQLTSESQHEEGDQSANASFNVGATDFVPGQSIHEVQNTPGKSVAHGKPQRERRNSKSTAPDLPTRIHEDITYGQYECVICTNEVLPNSKIWSCTICWTVVHMSCVKKWYTNQTKKPEQPGAEAPTGWRCPGSTHTDDHVPYSDTTLKFFRDNAKWAQTQEREFRVFASDPSEKRLRFKPMKSHLRAFLHSLAEDFGLDSESQDPEPHRHVAIFKTPRFVSAPAKTLGQCVKIRAAESQTQQAGPNIIVPTEPYNALILSSPQFGLTIEELESSLKADLATQPSISFTTSFLPSDEIVLRGAGAWTPQALEASVTALKPLVAQTAVSRLGLAKVVALCHVDASLNVLRREADSAAKNNAGGWNTVAGRSAARPATFAPPAPPPARSKFVALLKPMKKKPAEEEPVEEDWEAAAEKLDGEE
ncbi:FKBP12-associated protein [Neopestalotiopsis sp. 37M]|nr:FKBP12-associated protein [Neopestalotiopsis sp. 37M]